MTGNRRDSVSGGGWEMLFVAIDDHARIAFTAMHPDEKTPQAVQFLRDAVNYYADLGVKVKQLLTDNGAAFRSRDFAQACQLAPPQSGHRWCCTHVQAQSLRK